MWLVIRFCTWISDVTLVTSQVMKVGHVALHHLPPGPHQDPAAVVKHVLLLQMSAFAKLVCKVCSVKFWLDTKSG